MHRYEFHLSIPPGQLLAYYRGDVFSVVAKATDGRNIQFPASLLKRHVSPDGVIGHFVLTTDANNKIVELRRVGDIP